MLPAPSRPTPAAGPPDAALAERAQAGDVRAFQQIYRRYVRYVAGIAHRMLGRSAEVDDVVQDTFVTAHAQIATLRDGGALRVWLGRIAVSQVQRRLRERRMRRWLGWILQVSTPACSDPEDSSEVVALYEALERLAPDLRIPWVLARIDEHTLPEVAELCGVSLATVKRRIALADERLARRLDGR